MKFKLTSSIMILIVLTLSLVSAMEPQGFSPKDAVYADDTYDVQIDSLTGLDLLIFQLENLFAITPAIGSDTTYNPNDKVKFASDAGSVTENCNWGYLIMEIYRKTDSNGNNGQLYKVLKDDGNANVKKGATPNAYFSFTLPSDSANEYWDVVTYFTCGDKVISSWSEYLFKVTAESSGTCKTSGDIIGNSCFDNKVLQTYVASDCTQKQGTIEDCGNTASCQTGECVDNTKSCSYYRGDICNNGEVCNGDIIPLDESNCCSVTCTDVVECYADIDCGTGEYCSSNECVEKSAEEIDTALEEGNYVCCYLNFQSGGSIFSPKVSLVEESEFQDKCLLRARQELCNGLGYGDGSIKDTSSEEILNEEEQEQSELSSPIGLSDLSTATDAELKASQCNFDSECSGKEGYEVSCSNSEEISSVYPQYSEQIASSLGIGTVEGLCVYDNTSGTQGLNLSELFSGNNAILIIGGIVVLLILAFVFKK